MRRCASGTTALKDQREIISTAPAAEDWEEEGAIDESAAPELRSWRVDERSHAMRLDRALAEQVPEFSRSYLQQLIEAGAVQLDGQVVCKPAHRVRAGQQGLVELRPTPQSQAFIPERMALDIVYQDAHLLVINKPAGLVVHPAAGNWRGTLLNGLLAFDSQAMQLPRAGIVHRLDKDTSGLMLVARTRVAMEALVRMIAARTVSRQYLALAHGRWQGPPRREVEAAIGRDPRTRLRMAVLDAQRHPAKPARTSFELLHNAASGCVLRCTLHTGRTHQIRVHAAHIGHPLLGDTLYGGAAVAGLRRQALHAWRLALPHPVDGRELVFQVAPPADWLAALQAWGVGYNDLPVGPGSG
ncbi:MAG: RluA family pseudouridine synthase, partial [Hylemonella sp.]